MKQHGAKLATAMFASGVSSQAYQQGRRLILYFDGQDPALERIEFKANAGQDKKFGFLQRGHSLTKHSFRWTEMPKALARFFLEYLNAGLHGRRFDFRRVPQTATLGDALSKDKLPVLFIEYLPDGGTADWIERIFVGDNPHGRNPGEQSIKVNSGYLPPACVELYWEGRPLTEPKEVEAFTKLFLKAWEMPPLAEPELPVGEGSSPEPPPTETVKPSPTPEPPPQPEAAKAKPPPEAPPKEPQPEEKPRPSLESPKPEPEPIPFENIPLPIDKRLFMVMPSAGLWPDDTTLVSFGEGADWTLRNAFEGALILGATGSGKTSGSGATIAEAFLRSGFGGLILTVKTDEAEHWRKLCAHCGREKDFVVVRRGGDWRLNLLAYEAQRPGLGGGLSKNLVAFCRNLLAISARGQGHGTNEQFWQTASDQLLNAMFDLFLLAGGEITFDRLANFVSAAPTENLPKSDEDWLKIPDFGKVLITAKRKVVTAEDARILRRTMDYWCKIYPGLASKTRTSVTLGVFAMLDAFRGRDIPDLISSDTNLTPESIMSGTIVVLDLPLKEFGQTGLLVQSAWKYVFQMALERQVRAGNPRCRPVMLWEDEGQYFFSENDHHFQATARSARVCRVILSQNLHNFYKEFGSSGGAAANSVFGNLNTKVFHANNDPLTNEWSSKIFGSEIHSRLTISQNPAPPNRSQDLSDEIFAAFYPPSTTGFSQSEHWEPAVRPEEFNLLRNGGPQHDFEVDAYITWPGLADTVGQHFIRTTFIQNPNL